MHDQDVTEIEEERVPHYGNIPPPVIIHDHQDELEIENTEIYDFETEIIDTDNELIQEADVDDGTGTELNLIDSTVEDVQINIKEEDIDVEEIGATEMDREIIMDEDNLSPNSENNEEMNIKGSENDSDTNISYDDSSSIIVSSIESTPIASINEGDEEEDEENENTTHLVNRDNPVHMPSETRTSTRTRSDIDYRNISGIRDYNKNRLLSRTS